MPSTLDATVSGTTANSYATVAEGDTYFGDRLRATAWTGSSTDEKTIALLQAARRLDVERYEGFRSVDGQALQWPREQAFDFDNSEFASNAIPVIVKRAQLELALWLLREDDASSDPLVDTGLEGFNRVKVGDLEAEPRHVRNAGTLPQVVRDLLRPVLMSGSRIVLA